MNPKQPLDDDELNQFLREWTAPQVPARLRVPEKRRRSFAGWLRGSIAVPVPVALATLGLLAWLAWALTAVPPDAPAPVAGAIGPESAVVSLSGFQTVPEVAARRVGEVQ